MISWRIKVLIIHRIGATRSKILPRNEISDISGEDLLVIIKVGVFF